MEICDENADMYRGFPAASLMRPLSQVLHRMILSSEVTWHHGWTRRDLGGGEQSR